MRSIRNKTHTPLAIPLPRGKKLHLGPNHTGEIADEAVDHPPLKKLVEAGEIEILEGHAGQGGHGGKDSPLPDAVPGHLPGAQAYRSGDR